MSDTAIKLTHIIAIGGMSWGRGDNAMEALRNWIQNERPRGRDYTVHLRQVDEKAHVDGMGALLFNRCHKLPDVVVTKKLLDKIADVDGDIEELLFPVNDAELFD